MSSNSKNTLGGLASASAQAQTKDIQDNAFRQFVSKDVPKLIDQIKNLGSNMFIFTTRGAFCRRIPRRSSNT